MLLQTFFSFSMAILNSLIFWLVIGLVIAVFVGWRRLIELGLEEEKVFDMLFSMGFWGFIGARLTHVIENYGSFGLAPVKWVLLTRYPGLSIWGGLAFAVVSVFFFVRRNKWDFWQVADELVFAFLPFLFLAWIGIFFGGLVLGRQTWTPLGIFSNGSMIRRFPVPLFFATGVFAIWIFISGVQRTWRGWGWLKDKRAGLLVIIATAGVSLVNFALAFLTEIDLYFFVAETIISLLIFIWVFILLFLRIGPRKK